MTDIADQIHEEFQTTTSRGVRSAFRAVDLTYIDSNTYRFPVANTDPPSVVSEDEELPRDELDYTEHEMTFDKFGFELTDDADEQDVTEAVAGLEFAIAEHARSLIYDAASSSRVMVANDADALPKALTAAQKDVSFSDIDLVVLPELLAEAIADGDERGWDEIAADFEAYGDVSVVVDPYNVLRGCDVLFVDTETFGYEGIRTELTTKQYTEYKEHDPLTDPVPEDGRELAQHVTRAHLRCGFTVTDPDAAHISRCVRI